MIAIVAALADELAPLEKRLHLRSEAPQPWPLVCQGELGGRSVLLARMGLGAARAEGAVACLAEGHEVEAILSVGFGGAVRRELRGGQLVIAPQVYALEGSLDSEPLAASNKLACHPRLVELAAAAARRQGLAYHLGPSLTVPQVVGQPEVKRRIGRSLAVAMVEMESYWLGRAAAERGIPFITVRAIFDEVGDRVPNLAGVVDEDGIVHAGRAMGQLLCQPSKIRAVMRLVANGRLAAENLATFVEAFLGGFTLGSKEGE